MLKNSEKGLTGLWLLVGIAVLTITSAIGYLGYTNLVKPASTTTPTNSTTSTTGTIYVPPADSGSLVVPGSLYVSMGDSYSSGQGADRTPSSPTIDMSYYDPNTITAKNMCFRSQANAATLLAKDKSYAMTDVSCSAAYASKALTQGQWNEPPQIKAINSDVSLVTMTYGGNDAGLANLLLGCIMTTECKATSTAAKYSVNQNTKLPGIVNQILTSITQTAKNVKIRWAGYPLMLAAPGTPVGKCTFLSSKEQVVWYNILTGTNTAIKQGIDSFNAQNTGSDVKFSVKYVDPLAKDSPFMQTDNGKTRDACSTNINRAINGPTDIDAGWWHPNIIGQQFYYQLYKASL